MDGTVTLNWYPDYVKAVDYIDEFPPDFCPIFDEAVEDLGEDVCMKMVDGVLTTQECDEEKYCNSIKSSE